MPDLDYKALCAELVSEIQALRRAVADEVGCSSPEPSVIARALALLAQPEPQGPSYRDVLALRDELDADGYGTVDLVAFAHAVLARWGRPAIEPVPVNKCRPGPEDCDANGIVWAWDSGCLRWDTAFWDAAFPSDTDITHWLPHWALPVPQQEAE
jgi:hypothetical protein